MVKAFSILSLFLFAAFAAVIARAQTTPTVSVPVWVDKGECSKAPKFDPTLNGKPAQVKAKLGPTSDQIILVVFDLTGDLARIDAAKQAAIADISKLPKNDWVGVLRAQDGLHVLADPSPNRQNAIDKINALSSSGTPGLLVTVRMALTLANTISRRSQVRVAVFYITDGSIYDYREDYTDPVINPSDKHDLSRRFRNVLINEKISKLKRHISSLEVPLFVVQLHYRHNDLDTAYQNGLDTLARTTGGETIICHSISEIPWAISRMFARIGKFWRLILSVPPRTHKNVQVGMSASCGSGELQLSWRAGFHLKKE